MDSESKPIDFCRVCEVLSGISISIGCDCDLRVFAPPNAGREVESRRKTLVFSVWERFQVEIAEESIRLPKSDTKIPRLRVQLRSQNRQIPAEICDILIAISVGID